MKFLWLLFFLLLTNAANAFQNEQHLKNPEDEERAEELFKNIRCMVCQGESLAESNADLAIGMRKLVRDKISGGSSDEEILSYLTSRYGEKVLQNPPFEKQTYLLWLTPLFMLCLGGLFILKFARFKNVSKK